MQIRGFSGLTFRSFHEWDQEVDFSQRTLIYGHNGSGKSTLAALVAGLSPAHFGPAPLEAANLDVEGLVRTTSEDLRLPCYLDAPVKVFDAEYVRSCIDELLSGTSEPLWTIGTNDAALAASVTQAEQKLSNASGALQRSEAATQAAKKQQADTERAIQTDVRRLGNLDQTPLQGGNYATMQSATCVKLVNKVPAPAPAADPAALLERAQHGHRLPEPLDISALHSLNEALEDYQPVPEQSSLQEELAALSPEIVSWIRQGMKHHPQEGDCHFCGNEFTQQRLQALDGVFDDSVQSVEAYVTAVKLASGRAQLQLAAARRALADMPSGLLDQQELALAKREISSVESSVASIQDAFATYAQNPFLLPAQEALPTVPGTVAFETCRRRLDAARKNRSAIQQGAVDGYLAHVAATHMTTLALARTGVAAAEQAQASAQDAFKQASAAHEEALRVEKLASRDGESVARRLTADLRSYLGSGELMVQFERYGAHGRPAYRLQRHGEDVEHLSEGERTTLALLHFLLDITTTGPHTSELEMAPPAAIVWLDDPVTSMDGDRSHLAARFIHSRLLDGANDKCAQLVVSTHDYRFFSTMCDLCGSSESSRDTAILELSRHGNRLRTVTKQDLQREHAKVFGQVVAAAVGRVPEEQRRALNAARRALEHCAAWRYPRRTLPQAIQSMAADAGLSELLVLAKLKSLHVGSHGSSDDMLASLEHSQADVEQTLRTALVLIAGQDQQRFTVLVDGALERHERVRLRAFLVADLAAQVQERLQRSAFYSPIRVEPAPRRWGSVRLVGWQQTPMWEVGGQLSSSAAAQLDGDGLHIEFSDGDVIVCRALI